MLSSYDALQNIHHRNGYQVFMKNAIFGWFEDRTHQRTRTHHPQTEIFGVKQRNIFNIKHHHILNKLILNQSWMEYLAESKEKSMFWSDLSGFGDIRCMDCYVRTEWMKISKIDRNEPENRKSERRRAQRTDLTKFATPSPGSGDLFDEKSDIISMFLIDIIHRIKRNDCHIDLHSVWSHPFYSGFLQGFI